MTATDLLSILVGVAIGAPIGWMLAPAIYHVVLFVLSMIVFAADEAFRRIRDYCDKRSAR